MHVLVCHCLNLLSVYKWALASPSPSRISMAQLIQFTAELTSGTESVCFTVINGGTCMSVCDIIMVVCNKNKDQAGRTWQDMDEHHKEEVQS